MLCFFHEYCRNLRSKKGIESGERKKSLNGLKKKNNPCSKMSTAKFPHGLIPCSWAANQYENRGLQWKHWLTIAMQPMNNDALIMPYDLPRPGFCTARELLLVAGFGSKGWGFFWLWFASFCLHYVGTYFLKSFSLKGAGQTAMIKYEMIGWAVCQSYK